MNGNYEDLVQLAREIDRQESIKNDFIVNTENALMTDDTTMSFDGNGYGINEHAHGQLASKLGIPKQYYDKMTEVPYLRQANVNAWMHNNPERRMIRTLDGTMRAFLSDRFKPFDNVLVLNALLPAIKDHGDLKVMSNCLTEKRMYLQFKFPGLEGEVKQGDTIQAGLVVTNSEVGAGAVDIKAMTWRLVCTNGMIAESCLRKYHIGRRIGDTEEDYNLFTDETIQSELETLRLKMRDVIKDALSEAKFQNRLLKMKTAADDKIENLPQTVENVTKRFGLSKKEGDSMITNMADEGNVSRYGLANSITHLAHEIENPDRQYEYEKLGQNVIDLTQEQWKKLNSDLN